jgi:hypothetical protein
VLFRRRALAGRVERNRGLERAFEEAVRSKPVARGTRALCKLNGAKETRLTDYNNDPAVTLHESAFRSNQSPQSGPTMSVGACATNRMALSVSPSAVRGLLLQRRYFAMSEFCKVWHNITLEGAKQVRDHALLKASELGRSVSVVAVDRTGSYC